MSGPSSVNWLRLQKTFAGGSPVLAVGPGCHRIGYDETEEWQRVVERAGLVWHRLAQHGGGEELEVHRAFLVRFWLNQLRDRALGSEVDDSGVQVGGKELRIPDGLDIRNRSDEGDRKERGRIALATDLLCGLVDSTRLLGATIASGAVPVTDWQRVGVDCEPGDGDSTELQKRAADWLRRAADLAADLEALQLGVGKSHRFSGLAEHGLEVADGQDDKLHLLKIAEIRFGLSDLIDKRFTSRTGRISGAVVEWLSDLFWHVLVSGAGIPPSQDELSFYLNLRKLEDSERRFSRPHPGEYRGPEDGGEDIRGDLGRLLEDYDSGIDGRKRDWARPREAFALAIAASLVEIARAENRNRPMGRLAIALVSDYDLMLERAVRELLDEEEVFHIVTPAVAAFSDSKQGTAFKWLYGTVDRSAIDSEGRLRPSWQWADHVPQHVPGEPRGPVVIRLTGSPLLPMGTLKELGLSQEGDMEGACLYPAAIFSEHDSVRAIMALTQLPLAGDVRFINELFGPNGLTWERRSWLFFGHRFSDWLPRLQLLFTALMLARKSEGNGSQNGKKKWTPRIALPEPPLALPRRNRIALSRGFDWPEQALLNALDIDMQMAELGEVSRYFAPKFVHLDSDGGSTGHTAEFLARISRAVAHRGGGDFQPVAGAHHPKVFISYSREDEPSDGPWICAVSDFADSLAKRGLEVEFDQYGNHLNRDWSNWGPAAVQKAEYVVCVASEGYARKWNESFSSGVANEARAIREALAEGKLKGVLFVVLPGKTKDDIPESMRPLHHEVVREVSEKGVLGVVRLLTDQPWRLRPPLGLVPELPPR